MDGRCPPVTRDDDGQARVNCRGDCTPAQEPKRVTGSGRRKTGGGNHVGNLRVVTKVVKGDGVEQGRLRSTKKLERAGALLRCQLRPC